MAMSTVLVGPLDKCYPHLFDRIVLEAAFHDRLSLRLLSRNARDRVDQICFPTHMLLFIDQKELKITTPDSARTLFQADHPELRERDDGYCCFGRPLPDRTNDHLERILRSDEVRHLISRARVLDVSLQNTCHQWDLVIFIDECLHSLTSRLDTVRYLHVPYFHALLAAPRIVSLSNLDRSMWECYILDKLHPATDKFVLNIKHHEGDYVLDLEYIKAFKHSHTHPGHRTPKQFVIILSFVGPPEDLAAYLINSVSHLILYLALHFPPASPTVVINADRPDLDFERDLMPAIAAHVATLEDQWRNEYDDPELPESSRHDAVAMIGRMELITAKEYKERIGEEDFCIETAESFLVTRNYGQGPPMKAGPLGRLAAEDDSA